MVKLFILCVTLIFHSTSAILNTDCDYVLCKTKVQQHGDDYFAAEGSAISSQFVLPDGSLITNSKETTISSDGVKKTFHELKKEADRFVQGGSSSSYNVLPPIANIPSIPSIPTVPSGHIPYPYVTASQSGGQKSGFLQSQSGSSIQYQTIPDVASSSYVKESEVKKSVVSTSKGVTQYPSVGSQQYQYVQQNSIDNSNQGIVGLPVHYQTGGSVNYQDISGYDTAISSVPVQSSSYQSSYANSQNLTETQGLSGYPARNSFHTGVIDFGSGAANQNNARVIKTISRTVPTVTGQQGQAEQHYQQSNLVNTVQGYNAIPAVAPIKYQQSDYHSKVREIETAAKPAPVAIQYGSEQTNASSHFHNEVSSGLPTAHISKVIVRVNQPSLSSSQTFQKQESSSSQISGSQAIPVIPTYTNVNSGQYSSSGAIFENQQVPLPVETEISKSQDKKLSSSSQTYGFQSPVLVHGVPHTIPLDQHEASFGNSGSGYYSNGYVEGVEAVPVIPQAGVKSSSSSSSSSNFYSSSSSGSAPVGGSAFFYSGDNLNKLKGASASIYDSNAAETLCNPCLTPLSSSALPVKNSYGISSSFSSHATNINGQKTENREAAVAVNDNGKVDSYHVKS